MVDKIIPQRSELEELKLQSGRVTEESLESTRRMIQLMAESEEAGRQTIEVLDEQHEKLKHIEEGMDEINNDMTRAEKTLKNLKSCCNVFSYSWNKLPTEENSTFATDSKSMQDKVVINQPPSLNNETYIKSSVSPIPSSGFITRITNDALEDEMDSNLGQVSVMLGNLRNMAIDMNTELKTQNKQIDEIIKKGDSNNIRLDEVNISANNLFNKQ